MNRKPPIQEEELSNGGLQTTIWQVCAGTAEDALHVRSCDGFDTACLIEIHQGEQSVIINGETVSTLCNALLNMLKHHENT